jgi:hypothetical protein
MRARLCQKIGNKTDEKVNTKKNGNKAKEKSEHTKKN